MNQIFKVNVTCGSNVWDIKSTMTATIDSLLKVIKSGGQTGAVRQTISLVRNEQDKTTKNRIKGSLPVAMWQGLFTKRTNDGVQSLSSVMCFDFDHLPENEMIAFKEQLMSVPCVMAIFRSPSGDGLKVLIKTDNTDIRMYDNCYRQIENIFKTKYGIPIDESCRAISKACYLSYDPDIYINYDVTDYHFQYDSSFDPSNNVSTSTCTHEGHSMNMTPPTQQANFMNKLNTMRNGLTDEQIIEILDRRWQKSPTYYKDGHRHKSIFCQAQTLCRSGISEEIATAYLKSRFVPTGFNELELTRIVGDTYTRNASLFGTDRGQYLSYNNYRTTNP